MQAESCRGRIHPWQRRACRQRWARALRGQGRFELEALGVGQPSAAHAGLPGEGKPSSGLRPILSSALFRTVFLFVWWEADCSGGKRPARRRRLLLPWLPDGGGRRER